MGRSVPYSEALLQWLWKKRHLQSQSLTTQNDKNVHIHHPGYLNASDGPDFTNARITIGKLTWHGDVEIHWSSNDWFHHKHNTDKNFNSVILHVVYDDTDAKEIYCQDGTTPPTLRMKPHLSQPLQYFFQGFKQPDQLACAGNIKSVPKAVLIDQFEKAHQEYFEQKTDDLLQQYESFLPLSKAWQQMLVIGLFDGLGIRHNREPMRKLATYLLSSDEIKSAKAVESRALKYAGIEPDNTNAPFCWKRKGSRPANHPKIRIRQACKLLHFILTRPFAWWLRTDLQEAFQTMLSCVDTTPGIGTHQSGVLFGTIWLPAFYILGELTGTARLRRTARHTWQNLQTQLPYSIIKHFYQTDIPAAVFKKKLGSVHQYRNYCAPHKCEQCKVFNNIISS